jgi:quercetin dioxygenase-like cupin family protein
LHYDQVESQRVTEAGAERVRVRWLISSQDNAPNFYMRRFELEPQGRTPRHTHPWEHEVYVLEGHGTVFREGAEHPFRAGDFMYIAPGEEHGFVAGPTREVAFLCLIPKEPGKS